MKDLSLVELSNRISSMLVDTLKKEHYRIELGNDSGIRVSGVAERELFFALRCKVFKTVPPDPTKKPDPEGSPSQQEPATPESGR
jgi:hypothetical protein